MEDKIHLLYQQILCATKNGHDAEVRRDKDGNFVVYSVKKQRAEDAAVEMLREMAKDTGGYSDEI
ncbi:hypothetical protein [Waltera acetigignens]